MKFGIFSVVDHYPNELSRDIGQFYGELLDQCVAAEDLGFDSFWIAEHHFHEYGVIPSPPVWLTAAAIRTTRIRLGAAVVVLPLYHPLRAAEEYAMVDVLSNGRLNLGVGSGYLQHEFDGYNIPIAEKRARFDEALAIFRKAWTGNRFSHNGQFHTVDKVQLNVKPIQSEPPMWVAILRNEAAPFVGATGSPIMMIPYATTEQIEELGDTVNAFKGAFTQAGHNAEKVTLPFGLHTHCGPSKEASHGVVAEAMDRYVRTRLYAKNRPLELLEDKKLVAFGSPERIVEVARAYERTGLNHFLAIMNFGGIKHEEVLKSMELMAKEVLPVFQETSPVV